jgi:hypothetical protein
MTASLDSKLEDTILALLAERESGKTICPSEVARRVGGEEGWRPLMHATRAAARRLVVRGEIEVLQRGTPVDVRTAKGAIRLRLAR